MRKDANFFKLTKEDVLEYNEHRTAVVWEVSEKSDNKQLQYTSFGKWEGQYIA